MRNLFLVPVLIALGGCAQLQTLESGISLATKSIANPVTKTEEAQVELAMDTAVKALQAYKQACKQNVADKNCKANIKQIQAYTQQVPSLIGLLRNFVDNNDQVNASVVYNQLVALYGNVKSFAATAGVNLGALS